jgi:hypothetical protein
MAACAWNLRKWLIATAIFLFWQKVGLCMVRSRYFLYTLISSPTCPLSRFLESLKSDFKCPIIGSMVARLLHSLRFLFIAKGKDHKQYEYGNKVSIVSTKDTNIIVGVASHDKNIHAQIPSTGSH